MKNRVALVAVAVVSLLGAGTMAAVSTPSAATTGCSATYSVASQWQGGFQGGITVMNLGDALSGWRLEFDFPGAGQGVARAGTPPGRSPEATSRPRTRAGRTAPTPATSRPART